MASAYISTKNGYCFTAAARASSVTASCQALIAAFLSVAEISAIKFNQCSRSAGTWLSKSQLHGVVKAALLPTVVFVVVTITA